MSCGLTILEPIAPHTASKSYRIREDGSFEKVSDYDLGWEFRAHEAEVHGVDDVAVVVEGLSSRDAVIVRGRLTPAGQVSHRVNRRLNPRHDGDLPSIMPVDRQWMLADIDRAPLPAGLDPRNPADHPAIIEATVQGCLPEAFWGVRAFYQFSNSFGLTSAEWVKIHLFYWLSQPVPDAHLRALQKAMIPAIDYQLFNPVQPHFVTAPLVLNGVDPLGPHRLGWRPGVEAVVLPALPETPVSLSSRAMQQGDGTHPRGDRPPSTALPAPSSVDWLTEFGQLVGDGEGRCGFHEPLRRASARYAWLVTNDRLERNDAGVIRMLLRVARAAPRQRPLSEVMTYDETYMRRLIDGAFRLCR